jgi:hypothetical protein
MVIFFLQFREVFEQRFELSFREVFEMHLFSEVIRMHKFS